MGRKWTNMRFEFENRDAGIDEPSANPRTQEEVVRDYIEQKWDEDNIPPVETIDVMFGNYSSKQIEETVTEFFEEFSFLKRAAVIFVTDSANVGYGWVFERQDGEAELVEEFSGYENARGEDVSGEIQEKHHLRVSPSWYWD